jgi:hypothetical protein
MREIAGRELFAGRFGAVKHFGGDGDAVLNQFFGVFAADAMDVSWD